MKAIITELDPTHWRVSHVSYYQGTPLEATTIELFNSLDEAVEFVDDLKLELVQIDNLEPFPQYELT